MVRGLTVSLCLLLPSPALAADQSYKVLLGGAEMGWLRYSGTPDNARISTNFNNTPLAVFDGVYEGSSRTRSGETEYQGKSSASAETRDVEIKLTAGKVTEVTIFPVEDRTKYTDPAAVPTGLLDPVAGFVSLLSQTKTCPKPFSLYDGRRVVQVTQKSEDMVGDVRTCVMDYRVALGKGHLFPLSVKNVIITLIYDPNIANIGPSQLSLSAGLFRVTFQRE